MSMTFMLQNVSVAILFSSRVIFFPPCGLFGAREYVLTRCIWKWNHMSNSFEFCFWVIEQKWLHAYLTWGTACPPSIDTLMWRRCVREPVPTSGKTASSTSPGCCCTIVGAPSSSSIVRRGSLSLEMLKKSKTNFTPNTNDNKIFVLVSKIKNVGLLKNYKCTLSSEAESSTIVVFRTKINVKSLQRT